MGHKALYPRKDVDRLHVPRNGGRGLPSIQNSIDSSIQREDDIKKLKGRLITTTRNNTDITSINTTKITRKPKWKEKQLYGHFKRQTTEISHKKTWTKKGEQKEKN